VLGGDVGRAGQDLAEQVQQARSLVRAQCGQDAPLEDVDAGQQLVGGRAAVGRDLDQHAAPVIGIGDPADPAAALEEVEHGRHGGRRDENPLADLRGGQRSAGPVDDGQCRRGGLGHAEGQPDAPVELAEQGIAGADQRRVGLGARRRGGSTTQELDRHDLPPNPEPERTRHRAAS
jgi:hypothetical protein